VSGNCGCPITGTKSQFGRAPDAMQPTSTCYIQRMIGTLHTTCFARMREPDRQSNGRKGVACIRRTQILPSTPRAFCWPNGFGAVPLQSMSIVAAQRERCDHAENPDHQHHSGNPSTHKRWRRGRVIYSRHSSATSLQTSFAAGRLLTNPALPIWHH
jgi:hypothetical protein